MTVTDDPKTLVSTQWLAQHLRDPDLRILDASWYLPAAGREARAEYQLMWRRYQAEQRRHERLVA